MSRFTRFLSGLPLLLLPLKASALYDRSFEVQTGVRITLEQLFANLYTFLAASIVSICGVLFLIGASYMVASHGDTNMVDKGKKIMIGSLVGMGIVLGSYAILRTLFSIIY